LYYTFPLNYGISDSSVSSYGLPITGYGYFGQTINRKFIVDGWGTLIIPYGTFQVLRIKTTINNIDTIYSEAFQFGYTIHRPAIYEYCWIAKNLNGPALKISKSGMGYSAEFLDSLYYSNIPILKSKSPACVFPNPTSSYINVKGLDPTQNNNLLIFDTNGKLIFEKNNFDSKSTIAISPISSGTYHLKIISATSVMVEKLLIIK
jgi:hypothetical protein